MTMALTGTDPTSLYVSVCRYILSDSGLEDLYRMLPYLKQALSCCVCENLLQDPYGPQGSPCHHYVCRNCLGGRKVLRPPCGWCAEYRDFVPCRQQHILLNCYKKLCEYVACTSSGRSLLSANGASSSVLTSLQEGLMLPCDSPIPDREVTLLTGRGPTGPPVHTQQRVRGRGSHRVHRRWRRGGRGRGSRGGLGRGGFHHQRRSIISITPHGNRWRQRGVASRGTRHQVISREIRNLAGWGSFHQLELDDKQEETEVEDNVSVASNPSPPEKRSCRCGTFCEPSELTCHRQRCPCYSNQLSCAGCRCRGCKNPYKEDDGKKEDKATE
ncbi:MSL2 [Branchiostoma lanceolatum]|uniref:MSL2 protein n=1 Tax=Branchiostoma lanceolatum TaxID=7740 RepID=A0A8J9Z0M3_BRALA|nr:MSL2 [Branchiostoma lanceolatum]